MKFKKALLICIITTTATGCGSYVTYQDTVTTETNIQSSEAQGNTAEEWESTLDALAEFVAGEIREAFDPDKVSGTSRDKTNSTEEEPATTGKIETSEIFPQTDNAETQYNYNKVETGFTICSPYDEGFTNSVIPEYYGEPYVTINGNTPYFKEYTTEVFEYYSELDYLGRCGYTYANVSIELMPTEERGEIGSIKPTGWQTVKYDFVDGKYLYNRCHLLGYQLTGENANEKNLITGTRSMNVEGMLPFENIIADYVRNTGNKVLYRVTPVFEGENLLAAGVLMEAYSISEQPGRMNGSDICFCVFAYNAEPGVTIDYANGNNWLTQEGSSGKDEVEVETNYIVNTNTLKFHIPECPSVPRISSSNRAEFYGTKQSLEAAGFTACKNCIE